jgi:hypothetical protein
VIFNLINALCSQAQLLLTSQNKADAKSLHDQAENLLNTHEDVLSHASFNNVIKMVSALKAQLADNVSRRASESNITITIDTSDELSAQSSFASSEVSGVDAVSDSESTKQMHQSSKVLTRIGTFAHKPTQDEVAKKPTQDEGKTKKKRSCHCTIL